MNAITKAVNSLTLCLLIAACTTIWSSVSAAAPATNANTPYPYLLVWTSDKGTDDGNQNPDFLAVIDANPKSTTYGKVLNTAALPCIAGESLLDELGIVPGIPSCILNEAHHMTDTFWTDPVTGHKFLFVGGLISANIFKFDVTDPMHIPQATLHVRSRDVHNFAGTDDMRILPNGHIIATYMGSKGLTTPGGLVEFSPDVAPSLGGFIAEYPAARAGGPVRYVPNINGVTDAGLLAHPHGLGVRPDLGILAISDYADPFSLALSTPTVLLQDLGTTVRFYDLNNLAAGPNRIIQVPDGPRVEGVRIHEEPEGLMSFSMLNGTKNKGAFTASMCGGVLYYTPDVTVANPQFKEVYDAGPCTGASVFTITPNDHFMIMPVAGIQSPGDPVFNRDYPGEHSRRVLVLDIRPLLKKGSGPIACGPPTVTNDPITGLTTGILGNHHNNGASDCPIEISNINVDSALNFSTHGGPHVLALDATRKLFAWSDYFVDLNNFGLPGTGSGGDLKIYMANMDKDTGVSALDNKFKDELTGEVGVNFNRPIVYNWPNRGFTGTGKPHEMIFAYGPAPQ